MPIIFNGNVTIHGNVEMYDNGSMKISQGLPLEMDIQGLIKLINSNVKNKSEKNILVQNAKLLATDDQKTDKSKIKSAFKSIANFIKTLGRDVLIKGISIIVAEVIKKEL